MRIRPNVLARQRSIKMATRCVANVFTPLNFLAVGLIEVKAGSAPLSKMHSIIGRKNAAGG